jgi:class I fructose-bisphosphate aldolase
VEKNFTAFFYAYENKRSMNMSDIGKMIRFERIFNRNTGKTIIVPMDHGISVGPINGVIDLKHTIQQVAIGGANAIVEHKGLVGAGLRGKGPDIGLIIHLSASTALSPYPNAKTLVCTVEEAIKLGADAVSIHVNLGDEDEKSMLYDFGNISRDCKNWGIPLLAMIYARGKNIKDGYHVDVVKHSARVGCELGADIVKVPYTGSPETFRYVTEGCSVPVVIAGGEKMDSDREILEMVKGSIDAGGAGLSIGRNVFQHKTPQKMVQAMAAIIHDGRSLDDALAILNNA